MRIGDDLASLATSFMRRKITTVGAEVIMSNEVTLSDESLAGFSQPAKDRLRAASVEYIDELVAECYRLEASMNSDTGPAEITQGMVNDAVVFKKRLPTKKKGKGWRVATRNSGINLAIIGRILLQFG